MFVCCVGDPSSPGSSQRPRGADGSCAGVAVHSDSPAVPLLKRSPKCLC